MPTQLINRDELKTWLDQKLACVLIDTALADDFAVGHLPGAQNACVFEVNFLGHVEALDGIKSNVLARPVGAGPHRDVPIVVYGSSERSLASTTAAEKLHAAGFTDVRDFRGGLAAWREARFPTEGRADAAQPPPALEERDYRIDEKESTVEWTGRSLGGKHQGTLDLLRGGKITLRAGRAVGGSFTLDMTSISDTDLSDPVMKKVLHAHLKSDDFFDVEKYPQAHFFLDAAEEVPDAPPGSPNHTLRGRFLLKGVEKPLSFPAQIGRSPEENGSLVARANFDLDRTEWNVLYGSGKFYEKLGKHLVSDLITLDLKIVAR